MMGRRKRERALLLSILSGISERLGRANTIAEARFALEKKAVEMAAAASQIDPGDVATKMMRAVATMQGTEDKVEVTVRDRD